MVDLNKRWSVASVFDVYGMYRYAAAEMLANEHRMPHQVHAIYDQSTKVTSVADCISALGYTVRCCWTEESGRYVIWSIQNDTGFCYGSRGSEIYNHCPFEHQQSFRYLASHRTIYEKIDNKQLKPQTRHLTQGTVFMPARRLRDLWCGRLENISGEIPWSEMKELIDNGCISNMYNEGSSYVEGVSTLGNTLPPDIVEALKSFHSDDANFNKEPDYEFYITNQIMKPVCQIYALSLEKLPGYTEQMNVFEHMYEKYVKEGKLPHKAIKLVLEKKQKVASNLLFGEILRETRNKRLGNNEITKWFTQKNIIATQSKKKVKNKLHKSSKILNKEYDSDFESEDYESDD